jgi:predicted RND superfamily exporter protein
MIQICDEIRLAIAEETARSTLAAPLSRRDDAVRVAAAGGFPARGAIRIGDERIAYDRRSENAFEGCRRDARTAADHPAGARVEDATVEYALTGTAVYSVRVIRYIVRSLVNSFGFAFVGIFAAMVVLVRRIRLVGLAMIPNILPMIAIFATMGFLDIHLKPSTVLVASVALGVAVDDTIHFISRFRIEMSAGEGRVEQAIRGTLRTCGLPMASTSLILALGFLVLTASSFLGLVYIGFLVSVTVLAALLCDILLLSALLLTFRPLEVASDVLPSERD